MQKPATVKQRARVRYRDARDSRSSRRPVAIEPKRPPRDLNAKVVEISEVSTEIRSLRSKRVGPLTESEIPIEKKENQSRKVRHRAGHGYEDAAISDQSARVATSRGLWRL